MPFATHAAFVLFSELRPTILHSVLISYIFVTLYILVISKEMHLINLKLAGGLILG